MPDRIYSGSADFRSADYSICVREGDTILDFNPRNDLRNHSPTGVSWGYAGSGPAQLALALLADATGDDEIALQLYQEFKHRVVAGWPSEWKITQSEILAWVAGALE